MADSPILPGSILALASSIRNDGSLATFCFGTDVKPLGGGESLVYAVTFPDNVTWAVRVPVNAGKSLTPNSLGAFVESHAALLAKLDKVGFRWSPKLIHYDTGRDNLIKHPYLVLGWIHGTELEWTDALPSKPQDRAKILRQIVDIRLDLAERTQDLRTGVSALTFLTSMVDGKIERAATGKEPVFGIRDCFVHRALARHAVHIALESQPSTFVISHEDLSAHNIIIDSGHNITGIVDWSFARMLPLQLAFRLPRFLATEPDSPYQTASPPPTDVAAFSKAYLEASPALLADRHLVRTYLSSLVSDPKQGPRRSLAQAMKIVVSDPDVSWRYLIIEACFSRGLHAWLANRLWLIPGTRGDLANLDEFPPDKIMYEVQDFLRGEGVSDEIREACLQAVHSL